jgi:hypothetical protein
MQPVGRFAVHFLQMCAVMCAGAIALSLLFFGAARLLGYTDLAQTAPELSVLVIAINLSLPMAVWMRFMGMAWRPTLEMSGSTMVVGLLLIVAYWPGRQEQPDPGADQLGLPAHAGGDAVPVPAVLDQSYTRSRRRRVTPPS